MEIQSKYYTPEIEEFCVGFEYEIFQKGETYNPDVMYLMAPKEDDEWYKFKYPDPFLGYNLDRMFKTYKIRVKYLSKEDIESLGFNTEDNGECYNLQIGFDLYGLYPWENNRIHITKDMKTLFDGIIKNKSELKKLLKQLQIE